VGELLALPGAVYGLALPAIVLAVLLDYNSTDLKNAGWIYIVYLWLTLAGFLAVSDERLQASIQRLRWLSLAAGLLLQSIVGVLWEALGDPGFGSWARVLGLVPYCLSAWCLLLAMVGFGQKHLNANSPFLKYANEAGLPFYILHQTVIVGLGYFAVQWPIPDGLKFAILLTVSFLVTMGLYEILVRRNNVMRLLFGMKPRPRTSTEVRSILAEQGA